MLAMALIFLGVIVGAGCTRSCTNNDACGAGEICAYKIGDCAAHGECQDIPNPECGFESQICGCNGSLVTTGCGIPDGYATGPTTGAEDNYSCLKDSGNPTPSQGFSVPDASGDSSVDATADQ